MHTILITDAATIMLIIENILIFTSSRIFFGPLDEKNNSLSFLSCASFPFKAAVFFSTPPLWGWVQYSAGTRGVAHGMCVDFVTYFVARGKTQSRSPVKALG